MGNEMNTTMRRIMDFLKIELKDGAKYVSYERIAKEVDRKRHSVKYSIEKLRKMGELEIQDGKLALPSAV